MMTSMLPKNARTLWLALGIVVCSSGASAAGFVQCATFAGGRNTVSDLASFGDACAVQDKFFQWIGASPDVYLGNLFNSPVGVQFYGATQTNSDGIGDPNTPIFTGPVDIEFAISVIDPFNGNPNPQTMTLVTIADFLNPGTGSTTGSFKGVCIGGDGFDGTFSLTDDGCVVNGGTFLATLMATGNTITLPAGTTSIQVWDHIVLNPGTVGPGAAFGSVTETFTQTGVPEPVSFVLFGSASLIIGLAGRKRLFQNK